MNKAELIEQLAIKNEITKVAAERFIDSLAVEIRTAVCRGEDVSIRDFGTFTKNKRSRRNGVNPRTLEPIRVDSQWTPKFRYAELFKTLLNKGKK